MGTTKVTRMLLKCYSRKIIIEFIKNQFQSCQMWNLLNKFKDDNTKIDYIIINEVKCILITNDNSFNTILWDKENISYEIFGTISRKDIIKVVESMK
jgi:hypothetical protein